MPENASAELRKLAVEAEDILKQAEGDLEPIDADVQKIEKAERDLRHNYYIEAASSEGMR